MTTYSKSGTLVDVETGGQFCRHDHGGAIVTTEIAQHPFLILDGKAFVTLTDTTIVTIRDSKWNSILGTWMRLPGGCEVDVDSDEIKSAMKEIESCGQQWDEAAVIRPDLFTICEGGMELLVPCVVRDGDLPPVHVMVPVSDIQESFQQIEIGTGAHVDVQSKCKHTGAQIGTTNCRCCARRWWQAAVQKLEEHDGEK